MGLNEREDGLTRASPGVMGLNEGEEVLTLVEDRVCPNDVVLVSHKASDGGWGVGLNILEHVLVLFLPDTKKIVLLLSAVKKW